MPVGYYGPMNRYGTISLPSTFSQAGLSLLRGVWGYAVPTNHPYYELTRKWLSLFSYCSCCIAFRLSDRQNQRETTYSVGVPAIANRTTIRDTFKSLYSARTRKPYIGTRPSKKSIKRISESVRLQTSRNMEWMDAGEIVMRLNQKQEGANYFRLGPRHAVVPAHRLLYHNPAVPMAQKET